MIALAVCRIGICEICQAQFYLEAQEIPEKCPACNTRVWLYGFESREGRRIRLGIEHREKMINQGVTSVKLQAWSKAQVAKVPPTNIRARSKKIAEKARAKKRAQQEARNDDRGG